MGDIESRRGLKRIKSKYISISPCIVNTTVRTNKEKRHERGRCCATLFGSTRCTRSRSRVSGRTRSSRWTKNLHIPLMIMASFLISQAFPINNRASRTSSYQYPSRYGDTKVEVSLLRVSRRRNSNVTVRTQRPFLSPCIKTELKTCNGNIACGKLSGTGTGSSAERDRDLG